MYSRKSAGPRIEALRQPALKLPIHNHRKTFVTETKQTENAGKYITWNSIRSGCQTLLKAFNISSAAASVVPHLLQIPSILSDATVRRYAVDQEDQKSQWK